MESKLFQQYIADFERTMSVRNYKKIRNYSQPTIEFLEWLETKGKYNLKGLNSKLWQDYWKYLENRPNKRLSGTLSDSSLNNHSLSLKLFQEYLLEIGVITKTYSLPRRRNLTQKQRIPLNKDEIKQLYNVTNNQLENTLLSLAYGCGLRRTEIELLNTNDIDLYNGVLTVRKGKFGKSRVIPMSDKVLQDIKTYIMEYRPYKLKENNSDEKALLINQKGKRVKGGHLNEILHELVQRTQSQAIISKEITLHHLRHSIGTHLTENGANFEFVRDFLGHVELDTVHIYARRRKFNQKFKI